MKAISLKYVCCVCGVSEVVEARVTESIENSAPMPPPGWEFIDEDWHCGRCGDGPAPAVPKH